MSVPLPHRPRQGTRIGLGPPPPEREPPRSPPPPVLSYSPEDLRTLEHRARRVDAFRKIGTAIVFVLGLVGGIIGWAYNHAATALNAELRARIDPACLRVEVPPGAPKVPTVGDRFEQEDRKLESFDKRLEDPNNPQTVLGQKLDRLDRILTEQFGKTTTTTRPPKVGPTAQKQGQQ